jgi:3-phenylpropionate/trans-cinnamate dioxygenase ferredoxin subunit
LTADPVRVCADGDIALGTARSFMVGTAWIGVFHTTEGWFAIGNSCPHQGLALSDGLIEGATVTCHGHDRCYDLVTGDGPGINERVPCYPVDVRDGDVLVTPVRRSV